MQYKVGLGCGAGVVLYENTTYYTTGNRYGINLKEETNFSI